MLLDDETKITNINNRHIPKIEIISQGVYFFSNYGKNNVIAIEGQTSIILIDTLESIDEMNCLIVDLQKITKKPIKTIVYTHQHKSHRVGSTVCSDTVENVIAFENQKINVNMNHFDDSENTDKENNGLKPNKIIKSGLAAEVIDGIMLQFINVNHNGMGMIWLSDNEIMCCGDSFYLAFPNFSSVFSKQSQDIDNVLTGLNLIMSYDANYVLPSHLGFLSGKLDIQEILNNGKNVIKSIYEQTNKAILNGYSLDKIVDLVKLDEQYVNLPYLNQNYGTIEWLVREIFLKNANLFNVNVSELNISNKNDNKNKLINLIGVSKIKEELITALGKKDFVWALELVDLLISSGDTSVIQEKINILKKLLNNTELVTLKKYYERKISLLEEQI